MSDPHRDAWPAPKGALSRGFRGTVGDGQAGGPALQQGQERAAGRAACAEQQDAASGKREVKVCAQVADQPRAVRVVTEDAVRAEGERIDRAGQLRARGMTLGKREGLELEGHGDIEAAAALCTKARDRVREAV